MRCDELRERLSLAALGVEGCAGRLSSPPPRGELEPGDAAGDELRAHLAACSSCRERASALEQARRRLPDVVRSRERPLSPELRERILAGIAGPAVAAGERGGAGNVPRARWKRPLLAAALVAAGASLAVLLAPTAPPGPQAPPPSIDPFAYSPAPVVTFDPGTITAVPVAPPAIATVSSMQAIEAVLKDRTGTTLALLEILEKEHAITAHERVLLYRSFAGDAAVAEVHSLESAALLLEKVKELREREPQPSALGR
ncbi:hypothetical protein HY251_15575 [bacterium]|nr:hypothetical protein [bacterium]